MINGGKQMENEKVKLNISDYYKYLRETRTPFEKYEDPFADDICDKEEIEIPVEDWEKWHEYHYRITKKIEYLSSKKGKEQRKKDYQVVDFRTYYDIVKDFARNSNIFGHSSYVYADFPNSVIIGMSIRKCSKKGGYFHTIDEFMVLKSFYEKWKKKGAK